MEFLKSLWPNSSTNVITIPQHIEGELEDDLDLKVKALTYLFKRMNIENLPSFVNDGSGIYSFDNSSSSTSLGNEKLDAMYNKLEFERVLVSDEHRILIDWFKNRFRSICILSDTPKSPFERQLAKNFRFTILHADAPDDVYVNTLLESNIYIEHPIDIDVKRQIVVDAIQAQRQLRPSHKKSFNKNDRSMIISKYIRRLSEVVQIERIYKASLISKLETYKSSKLGFIKETIDEFSETSFDGNEENGVRLFPSNAVRSSRSRSPMRRQSNDSKPPLSPVKLNSLPQLQQTSPIVGTAKLSPPSSPVRSSSGSPSRQLRSRSSSPVKSLKKKQSMTILKMDNSLSQSDTTTTTPGADDEWVTKDEMSQIQIQSEQAVLFRVERERKLLRAQ
ncbi:CYFA0S19e01772g1_1 [Cyberlindnera fabianii]|uniref:CYFA0S19e01772g1_1 n=1 Tax=Cyberlindnera fabianii TaxID=36022 RepID=A0A061B8J1_CYBFA|nr:CYFA0S19e01772g1_1 [Cyberlindnera fabianii]